MKTNKLPVEVFEAACKFQLLNKSINYNCQKITDGVSSDIWYVKTEKNREFCIKRALAKLTVKEDWYAPISRNKFEAMYFKKCFDIAPNNFPKLLGYDNENYILAMEWYSPDSYLAWKKKLLNKKDVSMAAADEVKKITGFTIGGVSPVGHLNDINIYIDNNLSRFEFLYAAAGHPNCVFKTDNLNLIKISKGIIEDITE